MKSMTIFTLLMVVLCGVNQEKTEAFFQFTPGIAE